MDIREGLRQSFEVIRGNKVRSFLTMLGINFGVGCLIAISVVGLAFRGSISSEMGKYGTTLIWVQPNWRAYASREYRTLLSDRDISYFKAGLPGLDASGSMFDMDQVVSYKGNSSRVQVFGVEADHFEMFNINIARGRALIKEDMDNLSSVCVIRPDIASTLFEGENPLGKTIRIGDRNARVIGVTERQSDGSFISDGSDNNTVFVPQQMVSRKIFGGRNVKYWVYFLKFASPEHLDTAEERIRHYLNAKYGRLRGVERFRIQRLDSYVGMVNNVLNIISVLVLVIASISIVVGGLGIMNIMLVSVTERTREIGIRMAIGAGRREILVQFVIEAITLCLLGGGTGIIFGSGIAAIACTILNWQFAISLGIVLTALGISTTIGLIFGIYPAYKASKLMPVEALRSEV